MLTPEVFEIVLNNELKRAVRSQNFLTLLLLDPSFTDVPAGRNGDRERLATHIAGLVSREVRETDLIAQTAKGRLSVVLLDADLQASMRVVERLMARLEPYQFPRPVDIEVGVACCPTHGADAESLRLAAESRPVHRRRDARG